MQIFKGTWGWYDTDGILTDGKVGYPKSFVTTITNYSEVKVVLLEPSKATVKLG
jgi:hypothetical protein